MINSAILVKKGQRFVDEASRKMSRLPLLGNMFPSYRLERSLIAEVLASVPGPAVQQIRDKFSNAQPGKDGSVINHSNTVKYLDFEYWVAESVGRVMRLGLHQMEPIKILDIGCGNGHFLFAARALGHEVIGLDLSDNLIYNDFIEALNLRRIDHCIQPFEDLPELDKKLDLITGFMVWFNWSGTEEGWGFEEWEYFLRDCAKHLRAGGRIWLELNPGRKKKEYVYLSDTLAQQLAGIPGVTVAADKSVLQFSP